MTKTLFATLTALGIVGLAAGAAAQAPLGQTTVTPGMSEGSTTDAFNGATVTGSSAILPGFTVADAFGSVTAGGPYQESQAGGHVIFNDAGFNFIDFTTAAAVTITGFNIYLSSDGAGSGYRGFDSVSLFATVAGTQLLLGTATYDPSLGPITVTGAFAPITASAFRFESTSSNGGPRLLEIDAAVPEPATWAMMALGFGLVGAGLRARRQPTVRVAIA